MQFTALFDNEWMNVHMWIVPTCLKCPYSAAPRSNPCFGDCRRPSGCGCWVYTGSVDVEYTPEGPGS